MMSRGGDVGRAANCWREIQGMIRRRDPDAWLRSCISLLSCAGRYCEQTSGTVERMGEEGARFIEAWLFNSGSIRKDYGKRDDAEEYVSSCDDHLAQSQIHPFITRSNRDALRKKIATRANIKRNNKISCGT